MNEGMKNRESKDAWEIQDIMLLDEYFQIGIIGFGIIGNLEYC